MPGALQSLGLCLFSVQREGHSQVGQGLILNGPLAQVSVAAQSLGKDMLKVQKECKIRIAQISKTTQGGKVVI